MTWLSLMPAGSRAVVSALPGAHGLAKRMIALGLTPGAEVRVLQNRGHGPLLIEVHCARLALGWGQAAKVAVQPVASDEVGAASEACAGELSEEG
jgi:ferrous iron transport protein A